MAGQGPDRRAENPFETVITPATAPSLERQWSATTDAGDVLAGPPGAPVRSNTAVHVADGAALYGFDPATGTRRWRTPLQPEDTAGDATATAPFADGNRVLLTWAGSDRVEWGGSRCLDAGTGAVRAEAGSVPVDAARGTRRAGIARADDLRIGATLTYLNVTDDAEAAAAWRGLLNVESWGGRAVRPVTLGTRALYVSGQFLDSIPPTGPPPQPEAVRVYPLTAPAVCGGDGGALVIRCPTWTTDLDARPATSPVIGAGERTLYVATTAGTMYAIDAVGGDVLWTAALGAAPSADPALAGGTLYVPLVDGDLAAVPARGCGAATCPVAWRVDIGGAALQPAVGGGVVIVGTRDGTLQLAALDAAGCDAPTCPLLWRRPVSAAVSGAPAITGGRVYASLADGHVVAYAPGRAEGPGPPGTPVRPPWPAGSRRVGSPASDQVTSRWRMRVGDRNVDTVMRDPLAQELMASAVPARVAYDGLDGCPRVVPVGVHWTGEHLVVCSPTNSAKVPALQANPKVALTIDTDVPPQKVLLVRGSAHVEIVDGVPPEYLAGVHKLVEAGHQDEQWFDAFEQQVRGLYAHMARITITPEWAKLMDFETRIPKAVLDIVEGRAVS